MVTSCLIIRRTVIKWHSLNAPNVDGIKFLI